MTEDETRTAVAYLLMANLRENLRLSREVVLRLRDITPESNWELWTQWEERLARMIAKIDRTTKHRDDNEEV